MEWWLVGFIFLLSCFFLVVLRGAPWLPTRRQETEKALKLLHLAPGEHVVDLGCGGGGFLLAAARSGLQATGYEINPLLCIYARLRTWRYRDQVRIIWRDYWLVRLPACDGIYVFLIGHYMDKLQGKLRAELEGPVRIVSYVFPLPDIEPIVRESGLYLYESPLDV